MPVTSAGAPSVQLFAWVNYITTAALTAVSAAPLLPITNLVDPIGSSAMAWQTLGGVTTAAGGARFTVVPPLAAQSWRAFGVFRTNLSMSATVTFGLYNGTPGGSNSLVSATSVVGPVPGYGQVVAVLAADTVADYLTVSIDDPSNTEGFLNVPLAFAGPAWIMQSAADWSSTFGFDDASDGAISRGGQEYVSMRWLRRRWELSMVGIRANEVSGSIAEINRVSRTGGNILFCPNITDDSSLHTEAVYGRLTSTADIGYPYGAADRRSWKLRLQERI